MALFDDSDLIDTLAARDPLIRKIMAEIEAQVSTEAVQVVARRYADALSEMNASPNQDVRTRVEHVRNLIRYQRLRINKRWL